MNDARRKLIRRVPKNYLRTSETISMSVAGGTTYSLATDCQEPILFRYTSSSQEYMLERVASEREFFKLVYSASAAAGKPTHYVDLGRSSSTGPRQIRIFPTPDATYSVTHVYFKDPSATELTTSDLASAVPDIPSHLQDSLVAGTLWLFLKCFDDLAASAAAQAEFQACLIEADQAENEDQDEELSMRMGPVRNDTYAGNGIKLV